MKRMLGAAFTAAMIFMMSACGSSEGNMKAMAAMRDSVFAAYPDVSSVVLNVNNGSDLQIAIGSRSLFDASEADRKLRASELAAMAQRIFGPDAHLRSGRLLVTQNETNQQPEPEGALVEKMEFAPAQ